MILDGKTTIVYGAGGAIGSHVAMEFARQGALVHVTGPTLAKVEAVRDSIGAAGGRAVCAELDALDATAVESHASQVAETSGSIDVSFNAMGRDEIEIGVPFTDLTVDAFVTPLTTWVSSHFITATAAGRRMASQGSGVVLMLSSSVARMPGSRAGGFLAACTSIESMTLQLATELGPAGVRVVCLRPAGIKESVHLGSITGAVWGRAMGRMGMTIDDYLGDFESGELLPRTVTLAEVATAAAFLASDQASGITATTVNVSCGQVAG